MFCISLRVSLILLTFLIVMLLIRSVRLPLKDETKCCGWILIDRNSTVGIQRIKPAILNLNGERFCKLLAIKFPRKLVRVTWLKYFLALDFYVGYLTWLSGYVVMKISTWNILKKERIFFHAVWRILFQAVGEIFLSLCFVREDARCRLTCYNPFRFSDDRLMYFPFFRHMWEQLYKILGE